MPSDHLAYSNSSDSRVVQALCRDVLNRDINLNISASDEMLIFFVYEQSDSYEQAVSMYLDSGRRIWATLRQILAWKFGSLDWGGNLLDFASGYGRVTRHIVAEIPSNRVWVADIYGDGVAFQERELGVHGLVSTTDPGNFQCDARFDCILVSSLFTHLPEASFIAWLDRLGSLLTPDGLLLFSVHDISLRPSGTAIPPEGILFKELSESGSLDTKDYGSSWVTEEFVRSAVGKAMGSCPVFRIPRGLASYQDLYGVLKGGTAASTAPTVEREADGFLEHCSWIGKRSLRLSGWCADRVAGQPPREVRIRIDDVLVASCRDLEPRPLVGQAFANDAMEAMGRSRWIFPRRQTLNPPVSRYVPWRPTARSWASTPDRPCGPVCGARNWTSSYSRTGCGSGRRRRRSSPGRAPRAKTCCAKPERARKSWRSACKRSKPAGSGRPGISGSVSSGRWVWLNASSGTGAPATAAAGSGR